MNNVIVDLGFVQVYWYSVFIFLGMLVGGTFVIREAKKHDINDDTIVNFFFFLIPLAILGARLYYVAFNYEMYIDNPIDILKIWEGGLAIHGGIIAGMLYTILFCKKHGIRVSEMYDILCVGLIIGQAIGRWGNFFNQEAHGGVIPLETLQKIIPYDFIVKGMNIGGVYYQPTFFYESLWCLLGFVVLFVFRRLRYTKYGQTFSLYMIWYGIGRFFIEGLRTDSLMLGDFRVAQIVSVLMIIAGIIGIISFGRGNKIKNLYNEREYV